MQNRTLLAILICFLSLSAFAVQHPARELGFKSEYTYDPNGFDTINVTTGNIIGMIPLGITYPVGENLSYGFTLYYTGNLWDDWEDCPQHDPQLPCTTRHFKRQGDNAGFGWRISFGRLHPGATTDPGEYSAAAAKWRYESPDGSEHLFWETLHEPQCVAPVTSNCDPVVAGVYYTRDNSYLRLRSIGDTIKILEFPDGRRHRFEYNAAKYQWRLTHMYTAASTVTSSTGTPTDNFVAFSHVLNQAGFEDLKVTDSHGRTHWLRMAAADRITTAELSAYPTATGAAQVARYELSHQQVDVSRPCTNSTDPEVKERIYRLDGLSVPHGESWTFHYNITTNCDDLSGTLVGAILPTGGYLEWAYSGQFGPDTPNTVAVVRRAAYSDSGKQTKLLEKTYQPVGYEGMAVSTLVNVAGNFRPDFKTIYYRRYWWGTDFGLPYTTTPRSGSVQNPDVNGRYLSSETFKCDPSANTCPSVPDRATYVKYEMDQKIGAGCTVDDACQIERNRRPFTERTLYLSDGAGRVAGSTSSRFDGLGHYRETTTDGTFDSANVRTSRIEYNPAVGTYSIDSSGNRLPGHSMLSSSSPWLLETYTETSATEGSATEKRQHCFDAATGLLLRVRNLAGTTAGTSDLLTVYTRSADAESRGSVTREQKFGGDTQSLGTGTLCAVALPTDKSRINNTWQDGVLETSQYALASNAPLAFMSIDREIDPATGLIAAETDVTGHRTAFEYDLQGRLTWAKPAATGWTRATYTPFSAPSSLAQMEVLETIVGTDNPATTPDVYPTTVAGKSQWTFDPLGRVSKERRLLPNGTWSIRGHGYDTTGRKIFVSENAYPETTTAGTTFLSFDPYGRPGQIIAADGAATSFSYHGVRQIDRTVKIATSSAGQTSSTTTETYDRQGRLWRVTEPSGAAGANVTTEYSYDQGNRLKYVSTAAVEGVQNRAFTYDKRGLLLSEQHPELGTAGNGTINYSSYDALGQPGRRTNGQSDLLSYYDRAGRLKQITDNVTGRTLKLFTYDTSKPGRLYEAVRHNYHDRLGIDVVITETYAYDSAGRTSGRTTTSSTGPVFNQTFTYNVRGRQTNLGFANCTAVCTGLPAPPWVVNTYNNGFLTVVSDWANTIGYHANGMIASVAMANGVSWSQSISTVNWLPRPISITTNNVTNPLALTNYAYDDAGNVKSVGGDTFVYDKVGRLVSGSAEGGTKTQTQTYDSFGNIKTIGGVAQSPNAATNRLAGVTYDAGGTATYFAGDYFDIDPLGMVQAVHDLNYTNKYWAFVYTADDERIWKYDMGPANTSWWRLRNIDNRVVSEFVNVGATWNAVNNYIYREGILLGRQYASGATRTNTYFAVDHLGTPRRIFDAAKNVTAAPAYFAFGQETTSTSRNEDLRFTGHERDYGIGGVAPKDTLDYMHARHYSPNAGRFLSVDPGGYFPDRPQSWNRYTYALNNPILNTDPDGRCVAALPCPGWLATGTRTVATQVGTRAAAGSAAGPIGVAIASAGITGWQLGRGIGTSTIGGQTIDSRVTNLFVNGIALGQSLASSEEGLVELPARDSTGKVHGDLPTAADLQEYPTDELQHFQEELKGSVGERIKVTSQLGPEQKHGERQAGEQRLIKQIDKIIKDRDPK